MLTEKVKQAIEEDIEGAQVIVSDPRNDQTHLEAIVISEKFENLSLVKQHKLVMNSLKSHFTESLHALKLNTFTPKSWEIKQNS